MSAVKTGGDRDILVRQPADPGLTLFVNGVLTMPAERVLTGHHKAL